jgi:hypothetical protein
MDGFNRTAEIKGLCTPGLLNSAEFLGHDSKHEKSAHVKTTSQISMSFSGATCTLTAISIYKTLQPAAFLAEGRLQFENCVGGPLNLSMALVIGISEDVTGASSANLMKWMEEVEPHKVLTTPPPAPVVLTSKVNLTETLIGNGTCIGTEKASGRRSMIPTKDLCQQQCTASFQQARLTGMTDGCRGFAFHAANDTCVLYEGAVVKSDKTAADSGEWVCYNMTIHKPHIEKHTVATTTTVAPILSELDFLQAQVFSQRPMAYMTQVSAPSDAPTCFNSSWWFRLQDQLGGPVAIPIKTADFTKLMKVLPAANKKSGSQNAPIVIDRVMLNACNYDNRWGRTVCFVPEVKKNPICSSDVSSTAIVTGCLTAIGTWLLVAIVFFLMSGASRPKAGYEQLHEGDRPTPRATCDGKILLFVSVAALGGACLTSWGGFELVSEILRSAPCYDFDEELVIILASMLAAALAIIIFLQYLARVHPTHEHPLITNPNPPAKPETKLILVEVNDGEKVGHPVPVNSSMASGNAMASFTLGSQNSPNSTMMSNFSTYR